MLKPPLPNIWKYSQISFHDIHKEYISIRESYDIPRKTLFPDNSDKSPSLRIGQQDNLYNEGNMISLKKHLDLLVFWKQIYCPNSKSRVVMVERATGTRNTLNKYTQSDLVYTVVKSASEFLIFSSFCCCFQRCKQECSLDIQIPPKVRGF